MRVLWRQADGTSAEHGRGHDPPSGSGRVHRGARMAPVGHDRLTGQVRTQRSVHHWAEADLQEDGIHERAARLQRRALEPDRHQDD